MLGALILSAPGAISAQVTIDNDLSTGTLGHWAVDVDDAGDTDDGRLTANRVASMDTVIAEEIIFEYLALVDVNNNGAAALLSSSVTVSAFLSGDDEVTSSGSFTGANGNTINWTAVSSIPASSPTMTTTFTFTAVTGTLGVFRFHQYLDEDVEGSGDDTLFTRGTAATADLELFTVDNDEVYGVSHGGSLTGGQGLVNATFAGWAADEYSDLISALVGAGAAVSTTGVIDTTDLPPFVHSVVGPAYGPNDITSVLSWDVDPAATTATIRTTLGGVPEAPPPEGPGPSAPEIPTLSSGGAAVLAVLLIAASLVYLTRVRRRSG